LAPLDAWYVVAGVAAFAPLSCLGFFFSRLLFCFLLIFSPKIRSLTSYPKGMGEAMYNLYSLTKGPKATRDIANAMARERHT
jgi:hypothetical protein